MSGSIKWVVYTADNTDEYAVILDESNAEAGGFDDFTGGAVTVIPRYFEMRYVNAVSATGITRKFYIGKVDDAIFVDGGEIVVDAVTYQVSSKRGESRRLPRAADTGQTDGDAT